MKKLFVVFVLLSLAGYLFAEGNTTTSEKDVLWQVIYDTAKNYQIDNQKRLMRLKTQKVTVPKPIHKYVSSKNATRSAPATQAAAAVPILHKFDTATAWGNFKATVVVYPDKNTFLVSFESPFPVQGLELLDKKDPKNPYTVVVKNYNDVFRASFEVSYPYKPSYVLILKANINDEIQPQIIPLFRKIESNTN